MSLNVGSLGCLTVSFGCPTMLSISARSLSWIPGKRSMAKTKKDSVAASYGQRQSERRYFWTTNRTKLTASVPAPLRRAVSESAGLKKNLGRTPSCPQAKQSPRGPGRAEKCPPQVSKQNMCPALPHPEHARIIIVENTERVARTIAVRVSLIRP